MRHGGARRILRRMAQGYLSTARSAIVLVAALAALLAGSAAIVFPLWFVATRYTQVFTILALCLCAGVILYLLAQRVRRDLADRPGGAPTPLLAIGHLAWRLLRLVLLIALAVAVISLYSLRLYAAAIPATVVYIITLGYVAFGRSSTSRAR